MHKRHRHWDGGTNSHSGNVHPDCRWGKTCRMEVTFWLNETLLLVHTSWKKMELSSLWSLNQSLSSNLVFLWTHRYSHTSPWGKSRMSSYYRASRRFGTPRALVTISGSASGAGICIWTRERRSWTHGSLRSIDLLCAEVLVWGMWIYDS